jgi:hypothetical protein
MFPIHSKSARPVLFGAVVLLFAIPVRADLQDAMTQAWSNAETRSAATVESLGSTSRWPTIGSGGQWSSVTSSSDWRAGFWPGVLWFVSQRNGDAAWLQYARDWSQPLATSSNNNHDIGFIILGSMGKGLLCHDDVNDPDGSYRASARTAILRGAQLLNNRYNMNAVPAGFTRSWSDIEGQYPVCIDNLMNLEMLLLAYELDPARTGYFTHALAHARNSIARHMRADGSTYHVVRHFQSGGLSGRIERKNTRQGYGDESTWSRGQAWAIYGFSMTCRFARRGPDANPGEFLAAAEASADYFIDHLPHYDTVDSYNHRLDDFVPASDFDAALGEPAGAWNDVNDNGTPNQAISGTFSNYGLSGATVSYSNERLLPRNGFTLRDSSAAAIAASGLLELSALSESPAKRLKYRSAAEDILTSLITYDSNDADTEPDYLSPADDSQNPGILRLGSEFWGGVNRSLIYGDYYFLEALARWEALVSRDLLAASQEVFANAAEMIFAFERLDPAPALMFRIERSETLVPGSWVTVAAKTGAAPWSGTATVSEDAPAAGKVRVRVAEPPSAGRAFYRVRTLSASGL